MNLPTASHGVSLTDTALQGGVQNKETPQAAEYCTPVHNKKESANLSWLTDSI